MREIGFELRGEYIALDALIKVLGLADSGGAAKALVASGRVSVDGVQELRKTRKVRAGQQVALGDVRITVGTAAVEPPEQNR